MEVGELSSVVARKQWYGNQCPDALQHFVYDGDIWGSSHG